MKISGKVLKYKSNADDINTDVIWPGKYTYVQIPKEEMHKYAMETYDPDFKNKAKSHQILVVGKNLGCGSSREQASECLKYSGIKAIIARSFARIFYRNSINIGLPVIESNEAVDAIKNEDDVEIDLVNGEIIINNDNKIKISKYPEFVLQLIKDDGLINHIKKENENNKNNENNNIKNNNDGE
ncbi:3-isopropylmalate dehydratase [archaeon]|jgi:3-isopropylmalate/(R)-2-methylmalate dehydratase small subunit|nr:3-isopropylmalate dehydratase [archaeon]MBT5491715.1 3-isopropylmalate dehydratase [bacterium]MBT4352224.1 3-isopropylmalate dehydratase [archaeon]MBT4647347.1 3-isopropylmalate dehydratase [archaeon]MBT6821217.1 3-isopropylmalate dehydratase [archaeon]